MTEPKPAAGHWDVWSAALLAALTLWTFGPGLGGAFLWDDVTLIQRNARVQSAEHLPALLSEHFWTLSSGANSENPVYDTLFRPVVSVAYLGQWLAFDGDPRGFHAVSLALHLACAALVFRWLRRRLGGDGLVPSLAAVLGAGLFALHPTRPESVAWISGSTDLWMTFFLLLALWFWELRRAPALVACAAAFGLALLSKEAAIVVPALMLTDAWLLGAPDGEAFPRKRFAAVMTAFAGVLAFRLWIVPIGGVEAVGVADLGPLETVRRVVASFGLYLQHTLWPWEPSAQAGVRHPAADGSQYYATSWIATGVAGIAAGLSLAALAWRRPAWRPWLADALWFVAPLVPVLNVRDLGSAMLIGERFLYLPLIGLAAWFARLTCLALAAPKVPRLAFAASAAVVLLACAGVARVHVGHFASAPELWRYQYTIDPANLEAIEALAREAHEARRPDEALALLVEGYDKAVDEGNASKAIDFALATLRELMSFTADADQATLAALVESYHGIELRRRIQFDAAGVRFDLPLTEAQRARAISDLDTYRIPRAVALMRSLQLDAARRELEAIAATTSGPSAWSVLMSVRARQLDWEGAHDAMQHANASAPGHPVVSQMARSLARARALLDRPAADAVEQAIVEADVQVALGGPEAGRRALASWLEQEPDRPELVMAAVRAEVGDQQFERAIALVERARDLDPKRKLWSDTLGQLRAASAQAPFETRIWSDARAAAAPALSPRASAGSDSPRTAARR